jgi:hypothetical protein
MVIYEVTLTLDDPARGEELEAYMRGRHIPQIYATGCFREVRFSRTDDGRYRTSYGAALQEHLDRYLREYTHALRDDFASHFPTGVSASREVWTVVESWG